MTEPRQPYLNELAVSVLAPTMALCDQHGQIEPGGVAGLYVGDRRILSRSFLTVDGEVPAPLTGSDAATARSWFSAVVRTVGAVPEGHADPRLVVTRRRILHSSGASEIVAFTSYFPEDVTVRARLDLGSDLADMIAVRTGAPPAEVAPEVDGDRLRWTADDGAAVTVHAPGARLDETGAAWSVPVPARGQAEVSLRVEFTGGGPAPFLAAADRGWDVRPQIEAGDHRMTALLAQSVADLTALQLSDGAAPRDTFLAAGAPWYLTLFGRDSLWAARFALPLGLTLARGTLHTLARRQGTVDDPASAQQPGKIIHEVRAGTSDFGGGMTLPPLYYGTVDATALWISLLHDAWRWGLPADDVAPLLPNLEAALGWLQTAAGPDGFLRYRDETGHGLANQGWKDSPDAVQFRDGTLAAAPVALCEVQGYAHAAATQGAALLAAFGRPGGDELHAWAAALRDRFRDQFWVSDPDGDFPAIALDGENRPVDTVTSNIGHLVGTGLLDADETEAVVRRLSGPDMCSGFGLRTMSANSGGFNPYGYHTGSVWTHDTAIVINALRAARSPSADALAAHLIEQLLAASPAFGYRLPELFAGLPADGQRGPAPYPPSCRPQAWAAGAGLVMLTAALGLEPDVPGGTLRVAPLAPSPTAGLAVSGLAVGGGRLDVEVTPGGAVTVPRSPDGLAVYLS